MFLGNSEATKMKPVQQKDKSVADYIHDITNRVMLESGYPYPEGSIVDNSKAFAYGVCVGSLMWMEKEIRERQSRKDKE